MFSPCFHVPLLGLPSLFRRPSPPLPPPRVCFLERRAQYHRRRHKGLSPLTDGLTVVLHFNIHVSLDSAGARGILDRSVGRMDGWFDDRRDILLRHADSRCIFHSAFVPDVPIRVSLRLLLLPLRAPFRFLTYHFVVPPPFSYPVGFLAHLIRRGLAWAKRRPIMRSFIATV